MKFPFTHFFSGLTDKSIRGSMVLVGCLLASSLSAQNCPPPNPNPALTIINQITDSTAFVNWLNVSAADSFIVEYSPAGFPPGSGVTEWSVESAITLDSLNPCVKYDVYIYSVCSGDQVSDPAGPFSFTTTSPEVCNYTFNLFDSFGDGWNGAFLSVLHNGQENIFTLDYSNGSNGTFTLPALSSVPICISYSPGFFENEVTYNIVGPNGPVFSDGPDPETGNVLNFIACDATCAAPKTWIMKDVNATNAITSWSFLPGDGGDVFLEYGPMGFMRGTGTKANVPASQHSFTMTGLQENTWYNVYLGVDCGVDSSKVIGPLSFQTIWLKDVGVSLISPNADNFCNLGSNETITVGLRNYGQLPQTLFEFYFSVNGIPASIPIPQDGLFTGVVGNDSTQLIQFETTWDFSQPGLYVIEAWTELEDDSDIDNDTFRVEFLNSFPKPVSEDFEDLNIPPDWSTSQLFSFYPAGAHNNPSAVYGINLYSGNREFTLSTGRIGPVVIGDSLTFDYRMVNWFAGVDSTLLSGEDSLVVQISGDCEETFETVLIIDSVSHTPTVGMTNQVIFLDDYDGLTINVRFIGKWGDGDYWVDLDNINVQGECPASFGSLVDIEGAYPNDTNGVATIDPIAGTGPYTFDWSTNESQVGDVGKLEDIGPGAYFVDITDANGCMETVIFEVGTLVASDEVYGVEEILLYPNPTSGHVNLDIELASVMDVQTRVLDMSGRMLFEAEHSNILTLREQFDLRDQPTGLYIIQVVADGKPYYAKLMVAR